MDFKYQIEIDFGNDAFQPNPNHETVRILRELADSIENTHTIPITKRLYDANGNPVGEAVLKRTQSRKRKII